MPSKATNLTLVVRRSVPADGVVGDSKTALFVGLVQAHVDPGPVLLVKRFVYRFVGALFVEGVEERSSGRKTKKRFVSQRVVQNSPMIARKAPRVAVVQWQCSEPAPLSVEELHATPQFQVSAR